MLLDLIAQESVHRLLRASVRRHNAHGAALRQVLVTIRDESLSACISGTPGGTSPWVWKGLSNCTQPDIQVIY